MAEPVYITTPLYYVNAEPHLGSTYTTVVCDAYARFHRQRGRDVWFQTGTDEHGEKIAAAAGAAGLEPRAFVDDVSGVFRAVWDSCGIGYDHFIRTSSPSHASFVQDLLGRLHDTGDIYFGDYAGLYCVGCERLYTEKELNQGRCPQHLTVPETVSEPNYFFRMSRYQERVREILESRPDLVRPEGYRREALAMLREPLGDLCISRPRKRLEWGIELPFDREYVTYVWFDALVNYVSGPAALGRLDAVWPGVEHFIGKDILKPHIVFWPCMLLAAGLPLFRHLNVHGFWSSGGQKMSKSLGNVVRPLAMRDRYGMDALRYFLMREMAFGQDSDFTEDALVVRLNADLANGFGNFASRILAMINKYFDGVVQPLSHPDPADDVLRPAFAQGRAEMETHVGQLAFHRALEALWRALDVANKYVVETAPFRLARDPAERGRVGTILHHCLEALRVQAQLVAPFLPDAAERLRETLALSQESFGNLDLPWGMAFPEGHRVGAAVNLFPRVEPVRP